MPDVTGQRKFTAKDLAPLRGATNQSLAFPVVSADSDHRLLSLQPFGLLRSVNYIVTLAKPRLGLKSDAATQLTLTTAGDEIRRRR